MTTEHIIQNYLHQLNILEVKTLEDIALLIQSHEKCFAFSSLKVLLKESISLELEDIYTSLVIQKRGGYCFEHNKLIYEALNYLGFEVQFYLARVINNSDNEVPQTHRFTLLKYEGQSYIIDVGIGFRSPNVPVLLKDQTTLSHIGIEYKITEDETAYYLEVLEKGEWFKATKFDLHPCCEADFEMGNFYSYQHPCAVFVNNLVVSKVTKECIYSFRNNVYVHIDEKGYHSIPIKSKSDFINIITNIFDLNYNEKELTFLYEKYVIV